MKAEVLKHFTESDDITIVGEAGRTSSFEVTINGDLIFSKLSLGGFPFVEDIVESIKSAQSGSPQKITRSKPKGCIIL